MLLLVSVHRFESDTTDVKLAEKEAEILHDCIKKKEFKHEEIIRIITTRNKTQLIATFYRFKNAYNTPVTKVIRRLSASELIGIFFWLNSSLASLRLV